MDPVLTFTTGWDLILHQSDESQMVIPDFSCWRFFWTAAEDGQVLIMLTGRSFASRVSFHMVTFSVKPLRDMARSNMVRSSPYNIP